MKSEGQTVFWLSILRDDWGINFAILQRSLVTGHRYRELYAVMLDPWSYGEHGLSFKMNIVPIKRATIEFANVHYLACEPNICSVTTMSVLVS